MRCCLKEVQSKDTGRRTGTGSEVWHDRDELARDSKVLHPHRVMLYKSVPTLRESKVTCLTPGDLPYAVASRLRLIARLRHEQSSLIVWQKSAEGIVGMRSWYGMAEILWHRRETRRQTEKTKFSLKPTKSLY